MRCHCRRARLRVARGAEKARAPLPRQQGQSPSGTRIIVAAALESSRRRAAKDDAVAERACARASLRCGASPDQGVRASLTRRLGECAPEPATARVAAHGALRCGSPWARAGAPLRVLTLRRSRDDASPRGDRELPPSARGGSALSPQSRKPARNTLLTAQSYTPFNSSPSPRPDLLD